MSWKDSSSQQALLLYPPATISKIFRRQTGLPFLTISIFASTARDIVCAVGNEIGWAGTVSSNMTE